MDGSNEVLVLLLWFGFLRRWTPTAPPSGRDAEPVILSELFNAGGGDTVPKCLRFQTWLELCMRSLLSVGPLRVLQAPHVPKKHAAGAGPAGGVNVSVNGA